MVLGAIGTGIWKDMAKGVLRRLKSPEAGKLISKEFAIDLMAL